MSFAAEQDIMLEEEADRRRVVEENQLAGIVTATKEEWAEAERKEDERVRAHRANTLKRYSDYLASALNSRLGIEVSIERVQIVETGEVGEWYPVVYFAGVTFAYRRPSERYADTDELCIARPCERGCGNEVWVRVESRSSLVNALEHEADMHWNPCLVRYSEDGDAITDKNGDPLPEREPRKPVLTAEEQHRQAAERYAALVKLRRELEFKRPIEKAAAIKRLIDSQLAKSATAAKEMSHEDPDFAQFCQTLTDTVIAEMEARETLFVARKNAGISGAGASSASDEEESA